MPPLSEKAKELRKGYYRRNRKLAISRVAKWQHNNPEKVLGYKRSWKQKNERAWYSKNKVALAAKSRQKYKNDPEWRATLSARAKAYYQKRKQKLCAAKKAAYWKNPDLFRKKASKFRLLFPAKVRSRKREWKRKKFATDIHFVIQNRLACRIRSALKSIRKSKKTSELLGCPIDSFLIYLESQFEPEMAWGNYGKYWEIDHIVPCALFDLSKPEHQKRCFHFSNLRPYENTKNRQKRHRLFLGSEYLNL